MANFSDLPIEVIVHIFKFYSKTEGQINLFKRIFRVSSHWREICLNNSNLWTKYDGTPSSKNMMFLCKKGCFNNTKEFIISMTDKLDPSDAEKLFSSLKNVEIINFSKLEKFEKSTFSLTAENCSNLKEIQIESKSKKPPTFNYDLLGPFFASRGTSLTKIKLCNCTISNMQLVIRCIADCCPNLEELHLRKIDCSDGKFPTKYFQERCSKLKVLHLDQNIAICSSRHPLGFPSLEAFTYDDAEGYEISNNSFETIVFNSPNLKLLSLIYSRVSCEAMCSIPACSVEYLYIARSRMISVETFGNVLQKWCHSLKEVDISYASNSINTTLLSLVDSPSQSKLEMLNLSFSQILPTVVNKIIKACTQLQVLHLEGCKNLQRGMKKTYYGRAELDTLSQKLEALISVDLTVSP